MGAVRVWMAMYVQVPSHTVAAVRRCTMKLHVHVLLSTPPTSQIALVMGNGLLNEVLEANLTDAKPAPDSPT